MMSLGRGLFVAAVLLGVVAVSPLTLPVQLSYVDSDSMEPSIQKDDGYVLVPASDVDVGDVITFRTEKRNTPFTHRVVDVTDEGYVTKGDNNRVTDQASGYDHVTDPYVIGKVVTTGGSAVTVPGLGKVHRLVGEHLGVVVGLLLLLPLVVGGTDTEDPLSRGVFTVGDVVGPLILALSVLLLLAVVLSTDVHGIDYVATEHAVSDSRLLEVGEPATSTVFLQGPKPRFVHRFVSAEGAEVRSASFNRTSVLVTLDVPPPEETGVYTKEVRVHGYPATVPKPVLRRLHRMSPWAAALASVAVILSTMYAVGRAVLDWNRPVRTVERRCLDRLLWGDE